MPSKCGMANRKPRNNWDWSLINSNLAKIKKSLRKSIKEYFYPLQVISILFRVSYNTIYPDRPRTILCPILTGAWYYCFHDICNLVTRYFGLQLTLLLICGHSGGVNKSIHTKYELVLENHFLFTFPLQWVLMSNNTQFSSSCK